MQTYIAILRGINVSGKKIIKMDKLVSLFFVCAGIKEKITPHSFRHGWAHLRRDQNATLAFIQRGLGHASPSSTFIYEQYNDNDFVNSTKSYLKAA